MRLLTCPSGRRKPVWPYTMGPGLPWAACMTVPADLPSSNKAAPVRISSRLALWPSCNKHHDVVSIPMSLVWLLLQT